MEQHPRWQDLWEWASDPQSDEVGLLDALGRLWDRLILAPKPVGLMPFGWREADYLNARLASRVARSVDPGDRPHWRDENLFVASELAMEGGPEPWMADCIRAITSREGIGGTCRVLVTNPWNRLRADADGGGDLRDQFAKRIGIEPERLIIRPPEKAERPTYGDGLVWLLRRLQGTRVRRLWLFHHPSDVGAAGLAAVPALAAQRLLAHHVDSTPCAGLYLPGQVILDPGDVPHAWSRQAGLDSRLLPLTCPDPGLSLPAFYRHNVLTTCCAGHADKLDGVHPFSYDDVVEAILQRTNWRHVHIGPVDETRLKRWHAMAPDAEQRLLHKGWVPDLARAFHDYGVDVCITSVPTGGARTAVEAMAAGIPYWFQAMFSTSRHGGLPAARRRIWSTPDDLVAQLEKVTVEELEAYATDLRRHYMRFHHPDGFARRLEEALEAPGHPEPLDGTQLALAGALEQLRVEQLQVLELRDQLKQADREIGRLAREGGRQADRLRRTSEQVERLKARAPRRWWFPGRRSAGDESSSGTGDRPRSARLGDQSRRQDSGG